MKLKYEKNIRVLNDLMGYCHYLGACDFHIDFSMHSGGAQIALRAKMPKPPEKELSKLNRHLNLPRQREVEENYWNISGEEEIDNELTLAAMMLDSAQAYFEDGWLIINAQRNDPPQEA